MNDCTHNISIHLHCQECYEIYSREWLRWMILRGEAHPCLTERTIMNHGIATLHRDWDIFKKGDQFQITAYLQDTTKYGDAPIFAIWVGGMRGCTVSWLTFHWDRPQIDAWFDLELDECCRTPSDNDLPDDEFQKKYAGPI